MARSKLVTQEKVTEVKTVKEQYPTMNHEQIGRFVGLSKATIGRILRGEYDPKPKQEPKPEPKPEQEQPQKQEIVQRMDDDTMLLLMELADLMERNNRLLAALVLMRASDFDPTSTKDKSVAEAMRRVARENAPIRARVIGN